MVAFMEKLIVLYEIKFKKPLLCQNELPTFNCYIINHKHGKPLPIVRATQTLLFFLTHFSAMTLPYLLYS